MLAVCTKHNVLQAAVSGTTNFAPPQQQGAATWRI